MFSLAVSSQVDSSKVVKPYVLDGKWLGLCVFGARFCWVAGEGEKIFFSAHNKVIAATFSFQSFYKSFLPTHQVYTDPIPTLY